jgi:hypothetical protein
MPILVTGLATPARAPTQPVPVIRQNPKEPVRQISSMLWGLIPHWAKDASGGASTINERSETAATKPAFRDPLSSMEPYSSPEQIAEVVYEAATDGKDQLRYVAESRFGPLSDLTNDTCHRRWTRAVLAKLNEIFGDGLFRSRRVEVIEVRRLEDAQSCACSQVATAERCPRAGCLLDRTSCLREHVVSI